MEFPDWLNLDNVLGVFRAGGSRSRRIAAIGMFDGVHCGHISLIEFLKAEGARRSLAPTVVTFADHPLRVVRPDDAPPLLATLDQKMRWLREAGIDDCVLLDFNERLRRQSARQFLTLLKEKYAVDTLVVGFNHHVGSDRVGGLDAYRAIGDQIGLEVIAAPEFRADGEPVSSSVVRKMIADGRLDDANRVLGRNFAVEGTVVAGKKLGRRLGFPTANISPSSPYQVIPPVGVYAAFVRFADGTRLPAMVNVGYRPTVADGSASQPGIEAHLFDFLGYIYGDTVDVEFVRFIRPEKRFNSVEKLKSALAADEARIRQILQP